HRCFSFVARVIVPLPATGRNRVSDRNSLRRGARRRGLRGPCRPLLPAPNGVFRHGAVTGAAIGEPAHAYYAEFEFADKQAFDEFVRSEQFSGAGRDVMERGWKLSAVEFAELA